MRHWFDCSFFWLWGVCLLAASLVYHNSSFADEPTPALVTDSGKKIYAGPPPLSPSLQIDTHATSGFLGRSVWEMGTYDEWLLGHTRHQYTGESLGWLLEMEQHISGPWSAGLQLRWSQWGVHNRPQDTQTEVAPLTFMSQVARNQTISANLMSFESASIGYMFFASTRSSIARSQAVDGEGESVASMGVGVRWLLSDSWLLKSGINVWRGINANDYYGALLYVEWGWGDVRHL